MIAWETYGYAGEDQEELLGECWLILSFKTASKLYVVIVIYIKEKF